jgi:predicted S18 family serine protease
MKMWLTTLALVIGLAVPVFAQGDSSQQQSGQSQQQSTSQSSQGGSSAQKSSTTTTTTSNPTQVTRTTERVTGVDPIWLVVGGVVLLAIVLIAILSMRGRGGRDTVVRENTTVVKD